MKIRRYYRQPLIQAALLKLPDSDDIPCEIRNFCQAGLLLKASGPDPASGLKPGCADAEVVFTSSRTETTFRLGGRLGHVSAQGIGFIFNHAPPFQVLLALQEKALARPQQEWQVSAEQADIHAHCVQALENALRPLLDTLPPQVQTTLAEADEAGDIATQPQPGEPLEWQGRPIVERFYDQALEQAKSFIVPDLGLQPEAGAIYTESQSQRLAFEDWINLVDKIILLEGRYEGILRVLESRFSVLAQREIANHDNPFGPHVLCHSFHYSLQGLELNNFHRNIIYEIFTGQLNERMERLYGDLRILSKPLDALRKTSQPSESQPPIASVPESPKPTPTRQAIGQTGEASKPKGPPLPQGILTPLILATPAPTGQMPATDAKPSSPTLASMPLLAVAAANDDAKPPAPAPATTPRVERPPPPDAFAAFVLLVRYSEAQTGKPAAEPAGRFNRDAVIAALQKLRIGGQHRQPPYLSAPKLQASLRKILAESGQENSLTHAEVHENLQILGLLLETMLSDIVTPPCVAHYIKKLQIPLLIASFADPGLLYGNTHPAREMLNQLDHLTQAANAQGEIDNPQLLQPLDKLIDRLTDEVVENPDIFAETLRSLETLTAPLLKAHTMRLERVIEACEGGQRLEHARRLVDREIDARIGGKSVPALVLALLDVGWRQLLVLTCLRQGSGDDDWQRQLAVIDTLMEYLAKQAPAEPPSLDISGVKTYIQERLSSIGAEPGEANRILEKLDRCLSQGGASTTMNYVDVPPADTSREEKETALRTRLSGFRAGDWLRFTLAQGPWVPLRLTWIGQDPARYVFANRKGIKSLDLDAAKFAQFLDEKRASRIESLDSLSLVERSAKTLLASLRDRLR